MVLLFLMCFYYFSYFLLCFIIFLFLFICLLCLDAAEVQEPPRGEIHRGPPGVRRAAVRLRGESEDGPSSVF